MAAKKRSLSLGADMCGVQKEWDEALCPICMEHPHNAVLLLCSSHAKGCRPYICDTSYRHSNCLDRFRKLQPNSSTTTSSEITPSQNPRASSSDDSHRPTLLFGTELAELARANTMRSRNENLDSVAGNLSEPTAAKTSLKCPLCRGDVLGQTVEEKARDYLNLKRRSCTRESCSFVGNYQELRRHARDVHPRDRPAEVDPSRQRAWRRLEHQREHDDIVTAIRSAMPGAVVVGDYVIEESDHRFLPIEHRERASSGDASGPWWAAFLFFQMMESAGSGSRGRGRPPLTRHRRSVGGDTSRRYFWGENLLGLQNDGNDDSNDSFTDEELSVSADVSEQDASPVRRQRRRLTRSRSSRDRL